MENTLPHPMEETHIITTTDFPVKGNEPIVSKMLPADIVSDESSRFILIPLAVLFGIVILSSLVFFMARNRRRLVHIYCKNRINHNFGNYDEDSDSALEQPNDVDDDLNDPTECLLKGKLQIDNRYNTYQTTQVMQYNRAELLT